MCAAVAEMRRESEAIGEARGEAIGEARAAKKYESQMAELLAENARLKALLG